MPTFTGTNASEEILGTDQDDVIRGGGGDDIIIGYGGNDQLYGDSGNDMIAGGAGDDLIFGGIGDDLLYGNDGTDVLNGDDGADILYVGDNDTANGVNGDDTFRIDNLRFNYASVVNGGAGLDLLDLREANDALMVVLLDGATASETGLRATSVERVVAGAGGARVYGGINNDYVTASSGGFLDAWGGGGNDTLIGRGIGDHLYGGEGNDVIHGTGANSVLDGGDGYDILQLLGNFAFRIDLAGAEASTILNFEEIRGYSGGDEIYGGANSETINGGDGNDIIEGGGGDDTLIGGAGIDLLTYARASAGVTVNLGVAVQVNAATGTDTISGFENLTGSNFDDVLTGDAGDNIIDGRGGSNTIDGGAGYDVYVMDDAQWTWTTDSLYFDGTAYKLVRRDGQIDTLTNVEALRVTGRQDILFENVGGRFTGTDEDDVMDGTQAGDTIYGGGGNDIIRGNGAYGGRDYIYGQAGNDVLYAGGATLLDGGDGDDILYGVQDPARFWHEQMIGGAGDDQIYIYDPWTNVQGGDGYDILYYGGTTAMSYFTGRVEELIVIGDADVSVTVGMAEWGGARITGNAGDNAITGGHGADTFFGGDGSDRLDGGNGNDILVGNRDIFAQEVDTLIGGYGDDLLYGESVDVLDGGVGRDALIAVNAHAFNLDMGATSIEVAILDFGGDVVTAASQTEGVEIYASGGDDTVTGSAYADLIFAGIGDDVVNGGDGNDALIGDAGADELNGGDGDDRLYIDHLDTVSGGAGRDAAYIVANGGAGLTIDMAATSLEWVQDLAGGSDVILGSALATGFDAYVGAGNDRVEGSAFNDFLWGEAGDDTLIGGDGDDILVGGAGMDVLNGGRGIDNLHGGVEAGERDVFRFDVAGLAHADFVYNFEAGVDRIDLSAFGASASNVSFGSDGLSTLVFLDGQLVCRLVGASDVTTADIDFAAPSSAALVMPEPELIAFKPEVAPVSPDWMFA